MTREEQIKERKLEITLGMMNKALGRKLGPREYEEYVKLSLLPRFEGRKPEVFLELLAKEKKYEFLYLVNWSIDNLNSTIQDLEEDKEMFKTIITYITGDKEVMRIIGHYRPCMARTLARLIHGLAQSRPIDY